MYFSILYFLLYNIYFHISNLISIFLLIILLTILILSNLKRSIIFILFILKEVNHLNDLILIFKKAFVFSIINC